MISSKYILLSISLVFSVCFFALSSSSKQTIAGESKIKLDSLQNDTTIYTIVDLPAKALPSMAYFQNVLLKKYRWTKYAKRMGIEGKLRIDLIIEKDGSTNLQSITPKPENFEELKDHLFKQVKWEPAKHQNKIVRQRLTYISFICLK